MKTTFRLSSRFTMVLLAFLALGAARSGAQVATNSASGQLPPPLLDHDEMVQLIRVREQVFADHPELKAENEKLKALHDSATTPTADERNAAFAEWKDYQKKMRAEMLKIDPTMAPIFAKIDDKRKNGTPAPFQPANAQ